MLHTLVSAWNAPDDGSYSWAVEEAMAMLPRYPLPPEITGLPGTVNANSAPAQQMKGE